MKSEIQPAVRSGSGREDQLQFLRFLAFLNIYLGHASGWNFFHYPMWTGLLSTVSFFFLLSGMLTGYLGVGREKAPTVRTVAAYMWKKVRKVYPLYFATMIFGVVGSGLPALIVARDYGAMAEPVTQLLKNLLLVQSWFPEGYFSYNGVGWFVSTLMFLNLFNLPAVYLLNRANKHRFRGIIFGAMLTAAVFYTTVYCYLNQSNGTHFKQYIFPLCRMGEYLTGMIVGFLIRLWKQKTDFQANSATLLFTALEIGAMVFWVYCLFPETPYWAERIVRWLIPNMLLIGVFLMGRGVVSSLFRLRPLVRLGDVSFECFLIHQQLIQLYILQTDLWVDTPLNYTLALSLTLFITLLFAFLLNGKNGTQA